MSLALLCPGQGAQHPGMFDRVLHEPAAAPVLRAFAEQMRQAAPAVAAVPTRYDNRNAQPLLCAATLAHWAALRTRLPAPTLVLGYSVGELAAHAIAGSFDAGSCLTLAARRAQLMDAASPADAGLMAVIGLREEALRRLRMVHGLAVAIVNPDAHVVLGGMACSLQAAAADAVTQGARALRLPVAVPAHTPWLQAAADAFADVLEAAAISAPSRTVLAGIDGAPVIGRDAVVARLSTQIAAPVQWRAVLEQAVERGARVFLELGPCNALSRMVQQAYPQCAARAVEDFRTLDAAAGWVKAALEHSG